MHGIDRGGRDSIGALKLFEGKYRASKLFHTVKIKYKF